MQKPGHKEKQNTKRLFDRQAFIKLYESSHSSLMSYGMKICAREELTRDCIHEVFLNLWEKRIKYDDVKDIRPYLFKCLRNVLIDHLKENPNNTKSNYEITRNGQPYKNENFFNLSPEDVIINREIEEESKSKIHLFIQQLSPRQKEIFYLKFYDGLSYQEIAETTGIKYQSVRNIIFEGIKKLREISLEIYYIVIAILAHHFI